MCDRKPLAIVCAWLAPAGKSELRNEVKEEILDRSAFARVYLVS